VDGTGPGPDELPLKSVNFSIPEDAAGRVLLSRMLYPETWGIRGQVLIWTTDWSVWPSGEHVPLFARLREALGDTRSLEEANAQLIDRDSADDGQSLAIVNVLFLWDCWLIADAFDYAVFFCHDEWGQVYARSDDTLQAASRALSDMGLLAGSS
jgi:hypothetical protein